MVKTRLEINNVSFSYQGKGIFENLSFSVKSGEFVALVGPSGCGKTTLIHILAGLLDCSQGEILLNGNNTSRLGKISLMPQNDLLLPWRTISENGALPLEIKGVSKDDALKDVKNLLNKFGLEGYEDMYPYQLSGGMRQRVAFLRSVLTGSEILLLDEPFSALDALTRLKMQQWLLEMWQHFAPTIIFITHDVEEAIFLSQRIFLLSQQPPNKKIQEFAVPFLYPRKREILSDSKMVNLRQKILTGLEEG